MKTQHSSRDLVRRLGGHPCSALGLDTAGEADRAAWLVAACLLGRRAPETVALNSARALLQAGLAGCAPLADADPQELAARLARAELSRPEAAAALLVRVGRTLASLYGGSLEALASAAEGFEDLAGRVAGLAPGLGAATATRFLRPLRDHWPAAREVPLTPAARTAATCLGWLQAGEDEEGEPGALRAALAREPDPAALADVEAALERLGARACRRECPGRCPLGPDCPRRTRPT